MEKKFLLLLTILAAIILFAAVVSGVFAATKEYSFVVRGEVDSINVARNTIMVTGNYASSKSRTATVGNRIEYRLADATFYKWESGVKKQRNIKHLKVGNEVVMSGDKMVGSQYNVTKLTINDRSFTVLAKVREVDTSEDWIKAEVGRSTYKHAAFNGVQVKFHYNSETTCMRLGTEIGCSEIDALGQGIKLKGGLTGAGNKWELTNAWNNYY